MGFINSEGLSMRKFLLALFCLVLPLGAKAADYEIVTALSSPYGMFSTFSVFGDAVVNDLVLGAKSQDNVTPSGYTLPIFRPFQETSLEAKNISFGGDLLISRDLFLNAPKQVYGNVLVTNYSSDTINTPTFFDMNFTRVYIPSLYALVLVTGPITINGTMRINRLNTSMLSITNSSGGVFTFPQARGKTYGNRVYIQTPSTNCGADNNGHYYGPWITCSGGSCPSVTNNCDNDNDAAYTCPDDLTTNKNCIDIRRVNYAIDNIDTKPYISEVKSFYRRCVYATDEESGAPNCVIENYASGEESYDHVVDCSTSDINSCISLCSRQGGCAGVARSCKYREDPPTQFGADCALSGWDMGSGLECKDSYSRVMYRIYTCPAGSDYTARPESDSFSQYREVACLAEGQDHDNTDDEYCSKEFLVLDF